jgi:hypothetical protein
VLVGDRAAAEPIGERVQDPLAHGRVEVFGYRHGTILPPGR